MNIIWLYSYLYKFFFATSFNRLKAAYCSKYFHLGRVMYFGIIIYLFAISLFIIGDM